MTALVIGLAVWAVAATIALVHQHLRADAAVDALFAADLRNEQLTGRLLCRPVAWRQPRREVTPGRRPTPHPGALPAPPRTVVALDRHTLAPFPDPPPPTSDAFAAFVAAIERVS